ncbi:MAG: aspartate-semialdehyde dehydrogenase, partial [Planctomycetaceae bacterium]|nr:aspartate-semialdehyde dehydrogenase [Planctomycetaceae bacterium]
MYDNVAVVGATGAVGTIILDLLEKRNFPFKTLKLIASARSAGKKLAFKGQQYTVEELKPDVFDGVQLVIASTPDDTARDFIPEAVKRGCLVIDESGYWRMKPDVPLVIPEVNPEAILDHHGIISSPNCSTTQLVVALKPLHDYGKVRRVIVSTYQAVSGAGLAGTRDLENGSRAALAGEPCPPLETFPYPIAFNCIPQIGSVKERGYTSEELKLLYETRKMLGDDSIQICPTAVRVPVANCHSESVLVETEKKIPVEVARELFAAMSGVVVMDDIEKKIYPMPNICTGKDEVFVGR